MNVPTIKYQILKPDTHLDCVEFSLCPKCSLHIIRLTDGCSFCSWNKEDILLGGNGKNPRKSSDTSKNKLAIPCLIKQPRQPNVKGIIQKDLGDRALVYIPTDGTIVNVPKLLVYPDFSNIGNKLLQGGLNNCSSNCSSTLDKSSLHSDTQKEVSNRSVKCSSKKDNPPCTENSKTRRHKGEGSGHIYYRTVTRNGKSYQQAYYQWRENGKQRTKYIPKKLLRDIEEAEEQKLPVTKILDLLQGGLSNCSSKKFDTSIKVLAKNESDELVSKCSSKISSPPCKDLKKETRNRESEHLNCSSNSPESIGCMDKSVGTINNCSSKISNPPCTKKKRSAGCGGGYVEYREVKRNHKVYAQYWYHYEFWENGRCVEKKSKYIPKSKRSRIERMNKEKAPVNEILKVLKNKK